MNKLRVIFYIDGYNLYYGLRGYSSRKYLWLNLQKMAYYLTDQNETLEKVKYFTTMVSDPPDKVKRQVRYIDALKTQNKIEYYEGTFIKEIKKCWACGHPIDECINCKARLVFTREKKTDVNIGCQTLKDCALDNCEVIKIISADSDLIPVAETIKLLYPDKKVIFIFPPNSFSYEIATSIYRDKFFTIPEKVIKKCQFPNQITDNEGFIIKKPNKWY